MENRWYLALFGPVGGLASGLVSGLVLLAMTGQPSTFAGWFALCFISMAGFTGAAWVTFYQLGQRRTERRREVIERFAEGDLTVLPDADGGAEADLQRLALSLRRALWQVQRVTRSLRRSAGDVGGQSHQLLEAARRQGAAVERSQAAVSGMGESLTSSQKRVAQLEAFARETTSALTEMTESIEEVARALSGLNLSAEKTSGRMETLSQRSQLMAEAGTAVARLTVQSRQAVSAAEDSIDAVRRRSDETGELAREVTTTAEHGAQLVQDALRGIRRIDETVGRAARLVDALGTSSLEIGRVVDVIQEITDQTNLLALNAAIIASQAGESGRPFAVVAQEVRNLAEKTGRSTREIAHRVKAVREGVERAVELVTRSRDEAGMGVQLGEKASQALAAIQVTSQRALAAVEATQAETVRLEKQGTSLVEMSQQVTERVDEVVRLTTEQASQGRELVRQVEDMSRTARVASERAEVQVSTGRALSDSVLRLTAAIDEIRAAQVVLEEGDDAIAEEMAEVREDAQRVVRIGDSMSRSVEQLAHEAETLEAEVERFKLPQSRAGGTLHVGIHSALTLDERTGLDPLYSFDLQISELSASLYSTLLRYEDGILVPDVAESWEADRTARRYRFALRKGVTFPDGVTLTATHVKAHFERLLDPRSAAAEAVLFKDIEGAGAFMRGEAASLPGVEALDDHTLEFRLEEPRAFFLRLLALPSTGITRREGGKLLGTGPFRMTSATTSLVTLERNPTYYVAGYPLLSRLEFHLYGSRRLALEAFRRSEVQVVSYLHSENLREAGLDPAESLTVNTPSCWFLGFNQQHAPFDDVRVRRALRAGLDVRAVVDQFHPSARVARSLTPPTLLENDRIHEPRTDVSLARRLLAEAGQGRVKVTLHYPPDRDTREEDRALFKPLVDAGLVELQHVEAKDFWDRVREGKLPVFRGNWIADIADPDNFLFVLLNSRAQSYYGLGYKSPEFDRLTDEARESIDPGLRQQLYRKAEALVREDCMLVPLYHERFHAAASQAIQGLRLHQTPPQVRFEDIWLAS
jgi:methyl-accepting chemotaxis protein/ABC-type transport system substrate-binding protein